MSCFINQVLKTNAAVKKVGGKLALPAIHRYFMIGQRMGCLIFNLSKDATIAIGGSSWLTVRWRGVLCFESLVFGFALFFSNVATSYNDSNQPEKIEKESGEKKKVTIFVHFVLLGCACFGTRNAAASYRRCQQQCSHLLLPSVNG